jgi:hypothetical protein
MYIEQYSSDPSKYEEDAQKALDPIIKVCMCVSLCVLFEYVKKSSIG